MDLKMLDQLQIWIGVLQPEQIICFVLLWRSVALDAVQCAYTHDCLAFPVPLVSLVDDGHTFLLELQGP
jgi:hypothetical protein